MEKRNDKRTIQGQPKPSRSQTSQTSQTSSLARALWLIPAKAELTPIQKLILIHLAAYADRSPWKKAGCSDRTLVMLTGAARNTVRDNLRALEGLGLVETAGTSKARSKLRRLRMPEDPECYHNPGHDGSKHVDGSDLPVVIDGSVADPISYSNTIDKEIVPRLDNLEKSLQKIFSCIKSDNQRSLEAKEKKIKLITRPPKAALTPPNEPEKPPKKRPKARLKKDSSSEGAPAASRPPLDGEPFSFSLKPPSIESVIKWALGREYLVEMMGAEMLEDYARQFWASMDRQSWVSMYTKKKLEGSQWIGIAAAWIKAAYLNDLKRLNTGGHRHPVELRRKFNDATLTKFLDGNITEEEARKEEREWASGNARSELWRRTFEEAWKKEAMIIQRKRWKLDPKSIEPPPEFRSYVGWHIEIRERMIFSLTAEQAKAVGYRP